MHRGQTMIVQIVVNGMRVLIRVNTFPKCNGMDYLELSSLGFIVASFGDGDESSNSLGTVGLFVGE